MPQSHKVFQPLIGDRSAADIEFFEAGHLLEEHQIGVGQDRVLGVDCDTIAKHVVASKSAQ